MSLKSGLSFNSVLDNVASGRNDMGDVDIEQQESAFRQNLGLMNTFDWLVLTKNGFRCKYCDVNSPSKSPAFIQKENWFASKEDQS